MNIHTTMALLLSVVIMLNRVTENSNRDLYAAGKNLCHTRQPLLFLSPLDQKSITEIPKCNYYYKLKAKQRSYH